MKFIHTNIPEVLLIEPTIYEDSRGFFMESYQSKVFAEAGIKETFVQDNQSSSTQGVLRGLHYQIHHAQGKLVRALYGKIFDVAVDLRRSSPTFGKWAGIYLSATNKHQLWIPPGFAHGFYVLSDSAYVTYKVNSHYSPEFASGIVWNDMKLNISWPTSEPILSIKDQNLLSSKDQGYDFNF